LFAAGERGLGDRNDGLWREPLGVPRLRALALFSIAFAGGLALMLVLPAVEPGLATFYERTVESQIDRESPFSVWGQEPSLEWLQTIVKVFAIGLALLVAVVPRRRSLPQIAALSAAILVAVQLTAEHWFYLYIPWFFGLVIVGLLAKPRPSPA
jgi:hypothetical protein